MAGWRRRGGGAGGTGPLGAADGAKSHGRGSGARAVADNSVPPVGEGGVDDTVTVTREDEVRRLEESSSFRNDSSVRGLAGLGRLGEGEGGWSSTLDSGGTVISFKMGMCFFVAVETRNGSDADMLDSGELVGGFEALGISFKMGMCFFVAVETRDGPNGPDADVSATVELKIVRCCT